MPVLDSPAVVRPAKTRGGIDPVVSERIAMIRMPLILGVVFVHTPWWLINTLGDLPPSVELCIALAYSIMPRSAVPLFTFISGYLYFQVGKDRAPDFSRKNRARVRTLLVPYIIWNPAVLIAALCVSTLWGTREFYWNMLPHDFPVFIDHVYGLNGAPAAEHFWFVRNIIVLCLLGSTIYNIIAGRWGVLYCVVCALSWLFVTAATGRVGQLGLVETILYSIVFFSFGGLCSARRVDMLMCDAKWAYFMALWIVLGVALWRGYGMSVDGFSSPLGRGMRLVGCVAVWTLFSRLHSYRKLVGLLVGLSSLSFFVFAAHYTCVQFVSRALLHYYGATGTGAVFSVLAATPFIVLCVVMTGGLLLRKYLRPIFLVLGGQRGA